MGFFFKVLLSFVFNLVILPASRPAQNVNRSFLFGSTPTELTNENSSDTFHAHFYHVFLFSTVFCVSKKYAIGNSENVAILQRLRLKCINLQKRAHINSIILHPIAWA